MENIINIKTLSEMFQFTGMNAPKHPLIALIDFSTTQIPLDFLPLKVSADFYQIGFKKDSGTLKYGKESYDYQEGSLVFIAPGQVVEYNKYLEDEKPSGWSLFFHSDLIRSFPIQKRMKEFGFFHYQSNEALHVSEKEKRILLSILDKIEIELDSNLDEFSEELLVSNLELLLNYSKRFYNRQFITRKRFNKGIIAQFEQLLAAYFEEGLQREIGIPTVQYFADKLNYSANYLSDLIRKGTDKSIIEHIHYTIIEIAKNKLLNSNCSVSEIAFELGFEYSQYFSRLFKQKVGETPIGFRNLN